MPKIKIHTKRNMEDKIKKEKENKGINKTDSKDLEKRVAELEKIVEKLQKELSKDKGGK